jgi:hypothetical protein
LRPSLEGELVVEYLGEIISWDEALAPPPAMTRADPNHTFYFHVDETQVIDAWGRRQCGAVVEPFLCAELRGRNRATMGGCSFKAHAAISPWVKSSTTTTGLMIDERYTPKLKAEYPCWCGAKTCRGTLLSPKRGR